MIARIVALLATTIVLAGCTNDWPVEARAAGDTIELVAKAGPADAACVSALRISPARQEAVWEIAAVAPDGSQPYCAAHLPLRYGVAPAGFRTITPARPLAAGESYVLTGSGGRFLRGAFRYDGPGRPVRNFAPHSAEWCDLQYPGSTPDWTGQCVIR